MALELDYMEYASDAAAQAAYVTSGGDIYGSDVLTGGTPSASSETGGSEAPQACDDDPTGTYWNTQTVSPPHWWKYDLGDGNSKIVRKIRIKNYTGFGINAFKLQASDDDSWPGTELLSDNCEDNNDWQEFTFPNSTAYRYYRVYISTGYYSGGTIIAVYEFEMQEVTGKELQCYSESTIKQQGSYSLKGIAVITGSLNDTLTRTIASPIDLSGKSALKFDIYASRTGANIKLGIHDSGGTTTETTHTISAANTWETASWSLGAVADANKNAIDQIIITIVNADADNTFYIDNFYDNTLLSVSVSDAVSLAESIGGKGGDLPSSVSDTIALAESIKLNLIPLVGVTDAISIAESIVATLPNALESSVTDTISIAETIEAVVSGCIMSVTDSVNIAEAVSAVLHLKNLSVSDAISIAESISIWFPYYDVYSLDLYIDQVRSMDLFIKTTKTLDMYIDQVKSFTMEH